MQDKNTPVTVNGRNYFNEVDLGKMIGLLNQGYKIQIYIDCIGHTRTETETARYVKALEEEFGDRLQVESGFSNIYYLQ